MATITINNETHEIPAHVLHRIAKAARNELDKQLVAALGIENEAAARAGELEDFAIEQLNDAPRLVHIEPEKHDLGHYATFDEFYSATWVNHTACGLTYKSAIRVDMPPGDGAPTPSKPLCPECKAYAEALERWPS